MSELKHTPAPWFPAKLHEQGLYLNDGSMTVRTDDRAICFVLPAEDPKRGKGSHHIDPERDANARLIASAPDLLDALCLLERVYEKGDFESEFKPALARARAAINKATGAE